MFSPIERKRPLSGGEPSTKGAASCGRVRGSGGRATRIGHFAAQSVERASRVALAGLGVFAALIAYSGCSGDREEIIATIRLEAGAPDDVAKPCVPFAAEDVKDMGLDLYFLMERSAATMQEWVAISQLNALFISTSSEFAGMGAGFALYPTRMPVPQDCVDRCGKTSDCRCLEEDCRCANADWDDTTGLCRCEEWSTSCRVEDYAPRFEIARESDNPENLNGFFDAMLATRTSEPPPSWSDEPALFTAVEGSLRHRDAWEGRNPGRRITQVLVAKSIRSFMDCDDDTDRFSDVERLLGENGTPKTYVVAVNPSDTESFDALAQAGRTEVATQLRVRNPPFTTIATIGELIQRIRATDGRCEYLLPLRDDLDPGKVNLKARSRGFPFRKVANRAACSGDSEGWYYDSDDDPSLKRPRRVIACEGACKVIHGSPEAGMTSGTARLELGCFTVPSADGGR